MAGTREGAAKARRTILKKYGKKFYRENGRKGGQAGSSGGFASEAVGKDGLTGPERAKKYGKIYGKWSPKTGWGKK